MTVGQRVAQKRKELGLSQEGLGEQLGVSRQAIYKWESDASLPEIEKVVALSRIFSVTVGWLLGVEDAASEETHGPENRDLTEAQLKMVQEIVDRYLAAQPAPVPVKRRRWPFLVAGAVLLVVFINLFSRLDSLGQEYNNLQSTMSDVSYNVNSQISSITNRVEEVLKSQNNLTASYGTALLATDPGAGTATFSARAVPKTHTEGMEAIFLADSGEGTVELAGVPGPGGEFSAQISCALTDEITLSVVFVSGDRSETQVLDEYTWLYTDSFPIVQVQGSLWGSVKADGQPGEEYVSITREGGKLGHTAEIKEIRVGLFRDQVLMMWYEPCEKPENYNGFEGHEFFRRPAPVTVEEGTIYCFAAVVTDEYGREKVYVDSPPVTYDPVEGFLNHVDGNWFDEAVGWSY